MSTAVPAARVASHRRSRAAASSIPMTRVRRVGVLVLTLQLAGFLAWSTFLYRRFALTFDFAVIHQAWWQIAHGNLDPSTLEGFPYWRDHSDFMVWPLTLIYFAWPSGLSLLWLQDICVVAAELVAFTFICDFTTRYRAGTDGIWISLTGLILLSANPWIWWAVSFDFHIEAIALLLVVLIIRDLSYGRRRAWIWVIPLLACGDVAGTYLVGAGLGGVLALRHARRAGLLMAGLGAASVTVIALVHGNVGSGGGFSAYAYLASAAPGGAPLSLGVLVRGIATHPAEVLRTVWSKRTDVIANLAPAGLLGIAEVSTLPLILVVVLANTLFKALKFAEPIFQYLPVYILLPVGTVAVLLRLRKRSRALAIALCCLLAAQAIGWAAIWGPRTSGQWLKVSSPAAATLARVAAQIPDSATVIASEGIIGRFSGRAHLTFLNDPGRVAVHGVTWFVLAPTQGLEILNPASTMALAQELAGPLHAKVLADTNGIWAFRWTPPPGITSIVVPTGRAVLSAWATPMAPGTAGRAVVTGPPSTWHVVSTGRAGYVDDEFGWRVPVGKYLATVKLSTSGSVNVEVWDDNSDHLLSRHSILGTSSVESVSLPVDVSVAYPDPLYQGWGPFRADFTPGPPGQFLEVRVWSPGNESVNVYGAQLSNAN